MLTPETDESWLLLLHAADAIPLVRSEDKSDLRDLWRWAWCPYSFEQRKQAIQRLTGERYPDPRYAPTLDKYIRKDWKLTPRPMSNGATNGAKPLSFADQEAEKNKRAVARFLEKKNAENAKFA